MARILIRIRIRIHNRLMVDTRSYEIFLNSVLNFFSSGMAVRVDSDDDGGGKAITKKETRMLLAINSAESLLFDAMTLEMRRSGGTFDADKFVEVFRKYAPHFVQMLSAESSDDSDEEDERPLPKKYLSFLTAFARVRDEFVAAIERNYKVICKKDLKDLNFSVITSHPDEIFTNYGKSAGRQTLSVPSSPNKSQSSTQRALGTMHDDGTIDCAHNTDVSVDTDHASLLSGQEEELRKTIESESDTPTPTIEDWNGIRERRRSKERAHDLDKTMTGSIPTKLKSTAPDANTLIVPSIGQKTEESKPHHQISTPPSIEPIEVSLDPDRKVMLRMDGLKSKMKEVHQDLRFALPPMIERVVKANIKEKKSLTINEFVGREYADEKIEKFIVKMLSSDPALMQILELGFNNEGDAMVSLRDSDTMQLKDIVESEKSVNERKEKNDVKESKEKDEESAVKVKTRSLIPINHYQFYPLASELPLPPITVGHETAGVNMPFNGTVAVALSKWTSLLQRQLGELNNVEIDHLSLSTERYLEKGKPVLLKSDEGAYCRGIVHREWTRHGQDTIVQCMLIDYGDVHSVPVELMYAYPNWEAIIPPALILVAKLKVYPRGATNENDKFSDSIWSGMEGVLNEWKKSDLSIHIKSLEGGTYVIDLENDKGQMFTDELVKKGFVIKELPSSSAISSPPALSSNTSCLVGNSNEINHELDQLPSLPPSRAESPLKVGQSLTGISVPIPSCDELAVDKGISDMTINGNCDSSLKSEMDEPQLEPSNLPITRGDNPRLSPTNVKKEEKGDVNEQVKETSQLDRPIVNSKIDVTEGKGRDLTNMVEVKCNDLSSTIPSSMNVMNGSAMSEPSSLIVKKEEPKIRDFLEVPSSSGIPSLLQFIPRPADDFPPIIGLNIRRSGLVQVIDDE